MITVDFLNEEQKILFYLWIFANLQIIQVCRILDELQEAFRSESIHAVYIQSN